MSTPMVQLDGISKWYGPVLGVSDVSWDIGGGVVGLLGPNGAGKSTLIKLIVGLHKPSRGKVIVFGEDPFLSREARARVGYCPEHEGFYDELTALEFVTAMATLAGVPGTTAQIRGKSAAALEEMGLKKAMSRRVAGFSKGMKQRTKLAQCLVHDPDLWILDEPLTGVDPLARIEIVERLQKLGAAGKTIIVSSHVLREVESITDEILVLYRGQILAEGNIYKIRELIDAHPHRIRIECDEARTLGSELARADHVQSLSYERGAVVVETVEPDACYDRIAELAIEGDLGMRAMTSTDNNLTAVFDYLTGASR